MASSFRVPDRLRETYPLVERIGSGASGMVYRARQISLDRDVVVKLVHAPDPSRPMVQRALQEASLLAGLRHPNVVELLDHGICEDVLYLVYPDEGGRALAQRQDLYPSDERRVAAILEDVLQGLSAIHGIGAVHRDVKPANVLILPDDSAELIDLGLAKALEDERDLTRTGTAIGTPYYMAPGQVQAEEADPRDDLYAVGVIAYELLTGENPFADRSLKEVVERQLYLMPTPPHEHSRSRCGEKISWVVMALLEKDPDDRYQTAAEALEALREARPVTVERSPPASGTQLRPVPEEAAPDPEPPPRPGAGRPLAALALLLLIGLGVEATLRRSPSPPVSPPPSTTTGGWPAPLPPDFGERLREVYRNPPELDIDPISRGEVMLERRELDPFYTWLEQGGRPEELSEEQRRVLDEVDGAFLEQGMTPPFSAFLRARPIPDFGVVSGARAFQVGYQKYEAAKALLERPLGPWSALAHELSQKIHDRTEAARDARRSRSERVTGLAGVDVLEPIREAAFNVKRKRIEMEAARRVELREVEMLYYAVSRAVRAGEAHGVMAVTWVINDISGPEYLGSTSFLSPERLMGSRLETVGEKLLALQFLAQAARIRRKVLQDTRKLRAQRRRIVDELRGLRGSNSDTVFARMLGELHYQAIQGSMTPARRKRHWAAWPEKKRDFSLSQRALVLRNMLENTFEDGSVRTPRSVWLEFLAELLGTYEALPPEVRRIHEPLPEGLEG